MLNKHYRIDPAGLITTLILLLAAYLLAACQTTTAASPATVTARAQRVVAQATDMALQLREATIQDMKQATATAQVRLDRLAQFSTWPVVLVVTFDDNSNEWVLGQQTGEYADVIFTIANGVYHWEATPHQGFIWWNHPTISPVSDFYMAVDFRNISGPSNAYVGLIMGLNDSDDYYLFSLRGTGEYSLDEYYNQQWLSLIGWTPSPVFHEDEINRMEVYAEGGYVSLFVNGAWVADYGEQAVRSGLSGLAAGMDEVGESAVWEFDNFTVRSILEVEEVHTPEATARP
jgi:hypothetical protein